MPQMEDLPDKILERLNHPQAIEILRRRKEARGAASTPQPQQPPSNPSSSHSSSRRASPPESSGSRSPREGDEMSSSRRHRHRESSDMDRSRDHDDRHHRHRDRSRERHRDRGHGRERSSSRDREHRRRDRHHRDDREGSHRGDRGDREHRADDRDSHRDRDNREHRGGRDREERKGRDRDEHRGGRERDEHRGGRDHDRRKHRDDRRRRDGSQDTHMEDDQPPQSSFPDAYSHGQLEVRQRIELPPPSSSSSSSSKRTPGTAPADDLSTQMGDLSVKGGSSASSEPKSADSKASGGSVTQVKHTFALKSMARSPGAGTLGRPTEVFLNAFSVDFATRKIFRYLIEWPECEAFAEDMSRRKDEFIIDNRSKLESVFGLYIFERNRFWAMKEVRQRIEVDYPDEVTGDVLKVAFTLNGDFLLKTKDDKTEKNRAKIDLKYEEYTQLVHLMLGKFFRETRDFVRVGQHYFDTKLMENKKFIVKTDMAIGDLLLWRGFSIKIQPAEAGLQMIADVTHRILSQKSVANLLSDWQKQARGEKHFNDESRGRGERADGGGGRGGYRGGRGGGRGYRGGGGGYRGGGGGGGGYHGGGYGGRNQFDDRGGGGGYDRRGGGGYDRRSGGGGGRDRYDDRGRGGHDRGRGGNDGRDGRGDGRGGGESRGSRERDDEASWSVDRSLCDKAAEELIDRCVLTMFNKRQYRVHEIDWNKNIDHEFDWNPKNGQPQRISIRDYYEKIYSISLKVSSNGLLVNKPKQNNKRRRQKKGPDTIYLPPELCYLTGTSRKLKANNGLMKVVRDIASLKPEERLNTITNLATRMESLRLDNVQKGSSSSSSSSRRDGGGDDKSVADLLGNQLIFNTQPKCVRGRVLPSLMIETNQGGRMRADDVSKLRNAVRDGQTISCGGFNVERRIRRWIIVGERNDGKCFQKASALLRGDRAFAGEADEWVSLSVEGRDNVGLYSEKLRDELLHAIDRNDPDFIFAIIPRHHHSDHFYKVVKSVCMRGMDNADNRIIISQCIESKKFEEGGGGRGGRGGGRGRGGRGGGRGGGRAGIKQIMDNINLQINNKFGNVKWRAKQQKYGDFNPWDGKTMLCGVDVNHDNKRSLSAAGFVWSVDRDLTRYETCVSFERRGMEVRDMKGAQKMMDRALASFKKFNGDYPKHIIVYRDGVSDSELEDVYKKEVQAFLRAFADTNCDEYDPKLTFVVIQKRINTRMFSKEGAKRQYGEKYGSALVGTVVDGGPMSVRYWDFLITSTLPPPKKTATPTRYIVIHDTKLLTADQIQPFTYQLCGVYFGWQGTVRVPAPCQYSHNVAKLFGTVLSDTTKESCFFPDAKQGAYYL